jgi:hypothetical protein
VTKPHYIKPSRSQPGFTSILVILGGLGIAYFGVGLGQANALAEERSIGWSRLALVMCIGGLLLAAGSFIRLLLVVAFRPPS